MNLHHFLILQYLVHRSQCTVLELETYLQSKSYPLHPTNIYRIVHDMVDQKYLVMQFVNRLPMTKGYAITSQGVEAYHHYLQLLNVADPLLESPTDMFESSPRINWDDPDLQLELQELIMETLFDDPLTSHQKRRLQDCITQIVKLLQRRSSMLITEEK